MIKTGKLWYYVMFTGILIMAACKQSYNPPSINSNKNYLVVEGFINTGPDSTVFTLSRTINLDSPTVPTPELGAQLIVEGGNGYSSPLTELGNGRYGANALNLDITQNYRLSISTSNGAKYLSDYTPVKSSPPIDSISWQLNNSGVSLYSNTHDPLNNTHYYRWDYVETWEYHSAYYSNWHWDPNTSSMFMGAAYPHICWSSDLSNNIIIASSAKLSSDVIYQAPITVVPLNSEKLSVRYSVLLRQYALTTDEYNYWQALQASTERTGSLFDQQPSQITGNIKCISNPKDLAIGYVGVGSVAELRIFITNNQVLPWNYFQDCPELAFALNPDSLKSAIGEGLVPIGQEFKGSAFVGYNFSYPACVDCTLNGGTTAIPSFW